MNSHEHIRKEHYENSQMHGSDPEPISVWERNTEEDDEAMPSEKVVKVDEENTIKDEV